MAVLPPRRLTKQQFLKKAPINPARGRTGQERYQSYLNAYKTQHGGPHGPTARGTPNQPFAGPTYESLLRGIHIQTPQEMMKQAERMANIGITAQQKIIREEAKLMRDEAMARMQAQAAAGRAAAQLNAGLFGMVGGEYNAGAQEIRGLATNLSGAQAGAMNQQIAAQNAGLGAVGAPALAVGGPAGTPGIAGSTQAGVEAYRGGELPGQALGTAGEAATFGLAGMVSAQNLRATQEAQAGLRQSVAEADRNRMSALKELAAGRPAAAQQFLQQLQTNADNARNIAMSLLAARQQFGLQNQGNIRSTNAARDARAAAREALRVSKLNRANAIKQAKIQGREIDEARSFATGIYVDKMGRPILGKDGKPIPWKKPPSTSGSTTKGGVEQQWDSPAQKWEAISQAADNYIKDSFVGNTNVRPKKKAVDFLALKYPGTPRAKLRALVDSLWPKVSGGSQSNNTTGAGSQPP